MKKPISADSSFPPGQPDAQLNLVPQDQAPSVEVISPVRSQHVRSLSKFLFKMHFWPKGCWL